MSLIWSHFDFKDCVDVDECEKNVDTCDHQSKCENTDGSYKCVCQEGYQTVEKTLTTLRDQCIDINECVDTGDHSGTIVHSCWPDSTCVNSGKDFSKLTDVRSFSSKPFKLALIFVNAMKDLNVRWALNNVTISMNVKKGYMFVTSMLIALIRLVHTHVHV